VDAKAAECTSGISESASPVFSCPMDIDDFRFDSVADGVTTIRGRFFALWRLGSSVVGNMLVDCWRPGAVQDFERKGDVGGGDKSSSS